MHSIVTEKGQITIPVAVRRARGIKPGDRIDFQLDDNQKITLRLRKSLELDDIVGMLGKPPNGRSLSLEDMDDAIADAVVEHVMGAFTPKNKKSKR